MNIEENYSDKSFAIYGETKPHLVWLKNAGGKYNSKLTINEETVPGWIFAKSNPNYESIIEYARGNSNVELTKIYEKIDSKPQFTKTDPSTIKWETYFTPSTYSSTKSKINAKVNSIDYIVESVPELGWLILSKVQNDLMYSNSPVKLYAYLIGGTWKADPLIIPPPNNVISFSH